VAAAGESRTTLTPTRMPAQAKVPSSRANTARMTTPPANPLLRLDSTLGESLTPCSSGKGQSGKRRPEETARRGQAGSAASISRGNQWAWTSRLPDGVGARTGSPLTKPKLNGLHCLRPAELAGRADATVIRPMPRYAPHLAFVLSYRQIVLMGETMLALPTCPASPSPSSSVRRRL
jgi:hypothetical protein